MKEFGLRNLTGSQKLSQKVRVGIFGCGELIRLELLEGKVDSPRFPGIPALSKAGKVAENGGTAKGVSTQGWDRAGVDGSLAEGLEEGGTCVAGSQVLPWGFRILSGGAHPRHGPQEPRVRSA